MKDYQLFLKEGKQYYTAAAGKEGKKSKFSNDIRYNLFALSLEKCCMAILLFKGDLADNHTFSDLIIGVEKYVPLPQDLKETILNLEKTQTICSLYEYHREIPDDNEIAQFKNAAQEVFTLAHQVCSAA